MQTSMTFAVDNRLPEILERLRSLFPATKSRITDPLSQLIFAVISEDTSPSAGLAVFNRLKATYPRWSDLRDAPPAKVERFLVGIVGAKRKAEALPLIIAAIEAERGVIELDFLARLGTDAATRWLEKLPGVTSTTAAAVLSFSDLRRPVVSIGRDAARSVRRLGLAPPSSPLSAVPRHQAERAPSDWRAEEFADLGRGLARIARSNCTEGPTDCGGCILKDLCPSADRREAKLLAFPGPRRRPTAKTG